MKRSMLLLAAALLLTACDNTVEPVVQDAEVRYAVYGFLDMRAPRQVIRVEPLRPTILAEDTSLDGVQVTVIEEGTGMRHVFRDSSSVDQDGYPVSLFVAEFTPLAGKFYRLEVARPGERPTVARTNLPPSPVLQFGQTTGTASDLSQTLFLQRIEGAPESATVYYTVVAPDKEDPVTVQVNYGRLSTAPVSELNFEVNYFLDRFAVMNTLGLDLGEPGVRLQRIELSFDLPSAEWAQVEPRNIERGHGFFASVARYRYTWQLERPAVEILGWIDEQHRE